MQPANEKEYYEVLIKELENYANNLGSSFQRTPDQLDAIAPVFKDLMDTLDRAQSHTELNESLQRNYLFWSNNYGLTPEVKKSIEDAEIAQPYLATKEERDSYLNHLKIATRAAYEKVITVKDQALQKLGNEYLDTQMPPLEMYNHLTKPDTFDAFAAVNGFNTPSDKVQVRNKILEKWLVSTMQTSNFTDTKQSLLNVINTTNAAQSTAKLKEFAAKVNLNKQQIPEEFFETLDPNILPALRMSAVKRVIKEHTNSEHIRALAEVDVNNDSVFTNALAALNITNGPWMSLDEKKSVSKWAKEARNINEIKDKKANLQKLDVIINNFLAKPENDYFTSVQTKAFTKIFGQMSSQQQQVILDKLNTQDSKLLPRLFQATSVDAVNYYLDLKPGDVPVADLNGLAHSSLHNAGLTKLLATNKAIVTPEQVNQINRRLDIYYAEMENPGQRTPQQIYQKLKDNLHDAVGIDLGLLLQAPQQGNPPPPPNPIPEQQIIKALEAHAYTLQAMKSTPYYDNNKLFCDFLLAFPGFTNIVYSQAFGIHAPNAPAISDAIMTAVKDTREKLSKSNNIQEFKNSISNDPILAPIAGYFDNMLEADFIALKNETRMNVYQDKLHNPAALEEMLKGDNENYLTPKREAFRETRTSVNALIGSMNAYDLDGRAFSKEFASAKTDDLKKDLTELVDLVEKTEAHLDRELTELTAYKNALTAVAQTYPAEEDSVAGKFKKFKDTVTGDRAVRNHLEVVEADIQRIEKTRDALVQAKQEGGFNPKLPEDQQQNQKPSVLLQIDGIEAKSKENRRPKCTYSSKVAVEYKAVAVDTNYQQASTVIDRSGFEAGADAPDDVYEPAVNANQMMELKIPYFKADNKEHITIVTREVDNGHSKLILRKADTIDDTPKSNAMCESTILTVLEDALINLKPGQKLTLRGDQDWVARAWVAAHLMGFGDRVRVEKTSFNPNDRSAPGLIAKHLFTELRFGSSPKFGFKNGTSGAVAEELFKTKQPALDNCAARIEEAWALRAKAPVEAQQNIKEGINNIKPKVEEEEKREFRRKL